MARSLPDLAALYNSVQGYDAQDHAPAQTDRRILLTRRRRSAGRYVSVYCKAILIQLNLKKRLGWLANVPKRSRPRRQSSIIAS